MNELHTLQRRLRPTTPRDLRAFGLVSLLVLGGCLIAEGPPEDPNASGVVVDGGADQGSDGSDDGGGTDGDDDDSGGADGPLALSGDLELRVDEGASFTLGVDQLDARSGAAAASEAVYTLLVEPLSGTLQRRAGRDAEPAALAEGDTFTQADVTAGRVAYVHDGEEVFSDAFGLTLADEADLIEEIEVLVTIDAVDDPPSITEIADRNLPEDTVGGTGPIAITIADPDTALGALALWVSSNSNPEVCDPELGGRADTRNVTVTTAPDSFGDCALTVSLSDGHTTVTTSFVVRVIAVNDPPVVAAISDRTIAEGGGTGPIEVVLSDVESTVGALTLSASSDTTLCTATPTGSGSARTVEVTGAPDRFGECTITVTASDGEDTGSTAFTVRVTTVNSAPTISAIGNRTIDEDTAAGTGPIAFTVEDEETGAAGLAVTVDNGNPALCTTTLGGAGEDRTISVVPAPDGFGSCAISVDVSDGESLVSASFTVNVTAVNDAPVLAPLQPVVYAEDSDGSEVVELGISDVDDALTDLVVEVESDDALCRVPDEPLASPFAFLITSPAQQNGSCTVTVTVRDLGGLEATGELLVVVLAQNDPPSLAGAPASLLFDEDDPAGASFGVTLADPDDALAALAVEVTSSAPSICRVAHTRDGADVDVTVTGLPNQSGDCTVRVRVSDGELEDSVEIPVTVSAVNDAPTIAPLAPVTIDEEDATSDIPVVVADVETAAAELLVSAEVSDEDLCAATIGGTPAAPTVRVTGETDASGLCAVTVSVSDGALAAQTMLFVTIVDINDPPSISSIADTGFDEDAVGGTGVLGFTVADPETDPAALVVTADNDRSDLCVVALGGSGAARTVQVTNVADESGGTCEIELTVSDGSVEVTESFSVEVIAVNDVPTVSSFSLPVLIVEDAAGGTGPVPFTIGDVETDAADLTVTFDNSQNPTLCETVTLGGAGADRTVTVEPAADRTGTCFVDVEVSDGDESALATLEVRVSPVNDPPTLAFELPETAPLVPLPGDVFEVVVTIEDIDSDEAGVRLLTSIGESPVFTDVGVGGTGAERTVTLSLEPGEFGRGVLSVTAIDAEGGAATYDVELRLAAGDDGEVTWDGVGGFAGMLFSGGGWEEAGSPTGSDSNYSDAFASSGTLALRLEGGSSEQMSISRLFTARDALDLRARVRFGDDFGLKGGFVLGLIDGFDPIATVGASGETDLLVGAITAGCDAELTSFDFDTWYDVHIVLDAGELSVRFDGVEVCSETGVESADFRLFLEGFGGTTGAFDVAVDDIRVE
jgi:hypothetical protein